MLLVFLYWPYFLLVLIVFYLLFYDPFSCLCWCEKINSESTLHAFKNETKKAEIRHKVSWNPKVLMYVICMFVCIDNVYGYNCDRSGRLNDSKFVPVVRAQSIPEVTTTTSTRERKKPPRTISTSIEMATFYLNQLLCSGIVLCVHSCIVKFSFVPFKSVLSCSVAFSSCSLIFFVRYLFQYKTIWIPSACTIRFSSFVRWHFFW